MIIMYSFIFILFPWNLTFLVVNSFFLYIVQYIKLSTCYIIPG